MNEHRISSNAEHYLSNCDFFSFGLSMSKIVLGIDVSKNCLSLALLEDGHFISKNVSNSESGFERIVKFVSSKDCAKLENKEHTISRL